MMRLREQRISAMLLSLLLVIATTAESFPFASMLGKAAGKIGKSADDIPKAERVVDDIPASERAIGESQLGPAADEWGSVGGLSRSANYDELRSIINELAEKHAKTGSIDSHEALIRKVESEIDEISASGYYQGERLSEESILILQKNILSTNFIRKNSRQVAVRHELLQHRKNVGARTHKQREKVKHWLLELKRDGVPRHTAIREIEGWYAKSPSWKPAPSHSTMKRWAAEVYQ